MGCTTSGNGTLLKDAWNCSPTSRRMIALSSCEGSPWRRRPASSHVAIGLIAACLPYLELPQGAVTGLQFRKDALVIADPFHALG